MNSSQSTSLVLLAIVAFLFYLNNTGKLKPVVATITGNGGGTGGANAEAAAAEAAAAAAAASGAGKKQTGTNQYGEPVYGSGPSTDVMRVNFANVANGMFYESPNADLYNHQLWSIG